MNENLIKLIKRIEKDRGETLNFLIKNNVLTVSEVVDTTIQLGNPAYICLVSIYLNKAPIDKLADVIIKMNNVWYTYFFAKIVEGAPIDKLADAIIETKDAESIYRFARDVKGAPIDKLADAIIETEDAESIYRFAKDVKEAPIDKLADSIIKTKDAEYIYLFAKDVKGAQINKLADAILETKCGYYIMEFINNVKNAPVDKMLYRISNPKSLFEFSREPKRNLTKISKLVAANREMNEILNHPFTRNNGSMMTNRLRIDTMYKDEDIDFICGLAEKNDVPALMENFDYIQGMLRKNLDQKSDSKKLIRKKG